MLRGWQIRGARRRRVARWQAGAVGVALLAIRPAAAYRTGADTPDLADTSRVTWPSNDVELTLSGPTPSGLAPQSVHDTLLAAVGTWNSVSCSAARLHVAPATGEAPRRGDGVSSVAWVADWTARGFQADAPGVTDTQYERDAQGAWRIVEADVYLNAQHFGWALSFAVDGEREIPAVLTHELGHVLGLLHPCEVDRSVDPAAPACSASATYAADTMYPLYSATQAQLAADDIAGLCFLYPPALCGAGCPAGQACAQGSCVETCSGAVCAPGEVCAATGCGPAPCVDCGNGTKPLGDPCESGADCASAACGGDAVCRAQCFGAADCGAGDQCAPALEHLTACTGALAGFGAPCVFECGAPGEYKPQ